MGPFRKSPKRSKKSTPARKHHRKKRLAWKTYSQREMITAIRNWAAQSRLPTETTTKTPNHPLSSTKVFKNRQLRQMYVQLRESNFAGHGTWPAFLEKKAGFVPVKRIEAFVPTPSGYAKPIELVVPIHPTLKSTQAIIRKFWPHIRTSHVRTREVLGFKFIHRFAAANNYFGTGGWPQFVKRAIVRPKKEST